MSATPDIGGGQPPWLLLFDIDGTLMTGATRAHAQSLREALHTVHGVDAGAVRDPPTPAGRTDGEIARLILIAAGVSAERIDERAAEVRMRCCERYARMANEDLSHTVVPGVAALVAELAGRRDVRLGLVTGNYEPVARLKLRQAGLERPFSSCPGGFGSDSEDRAALPGIARRRAGPPGHPQPRERTVVIGDTPRDIACAQADGVRCLAVTTGPHRAGELSAADGVVTTAAELRAAILQLAGGTAEAAAKA